VRCVNMMLYFKTKCEHLTCTETEELFLKMLKNSNSEYYENLQ